MTTAERAIFNLRRHRKLYHDYDWIKVHADAVDALLTYVAQLEASQPQRDAPAPDLAEPKPPFICDGCESRNILVFDGSHGWAAQCRRCGKIWNWWGREVWPHP